MADSIDWKNGRTPVSQKFGDVYFDAQDGAAETQYVFLEGNELAQRWAALSGSQSEFVIGELGFGTGLNFLAAAALWKLTNLKSANLRFVSCEYYPLEPADLERALMQWTELGKIVGMPELSALAAWYSPVLGESRQLEFDPGISLELHFLEAKQALAHYPKVHAWFLDGFAPAKNPDMWRDEILNAIAEKSASGATFATFTAAGHVRRGLQTRGFDVEKRKGFGRKREMLVGRRSKS